MAGDGNFFSTPYDDAPDFEKVHRKTTLNAADPLELIVMFSITKVRLCGTLRYSKKYDSKLRVVEHSKRLYQRLLPFSHTSVDIFSHFRR